VSNNLQRGGSLSCGCLRRERTSAANSLPGDLAAFNSLFGCYKVRSRKFGIVFEFNKDQFRNIISSDCCYCGAKPSNVHKHYKTSIVYNGIDRINPSNGYVVENCVSCCWTCNSAKSNMSIDEFRSWHRRLNHHNAVPETESMKMSRVFKNMERVFG